MKSSAERYAQAVHENLSHLDQGDQEMRAIMEGGEVRAPFKLEIMFSTNRTIVGPNMSVVQAWESGKRLNGGGDELIYWCKDINTDAGCWRPILGDDMSSGLAFCSNCGTLASERLVGQRYQRVTTRALAEHIAKLWRQLDQGADIYCKYDPKDIRVEIMEKKVGSVRAHELRGLSIYPLANILKDTAAGSSVEDRFDAFFRQ